MDVFHNWLTKGIALGVLKQKMSEFSHRWAKVAAQKLERYGCKKTSKNRWQFGKSFQISDLANCRYHVFIPQLIGQLTWQDLGLNRFFFHLCGVFWVEDRTQWNPCCFCQIHLEISCKCSHGPRKNYVEISIAVFFFWWHLLRFREVSSGNPTATKCLPSSGMRTLFEIHILTASPGWYRIFL